MNNLSLVLQKAGARRGGDTVVVAGSRGRDPGSMNNPGVILRLAGREA